MRSVDAEELAGIYGLFELLPSMEREAIIEAVQIGGRAHKFRSCHYRDGRKQDSVIGSAMRRLGRLNGSGDGVRSGCAKSRIAVAMTRVAE